MINFGHGNWLLVRHTGEASYVRHAQSLSSMDATTKWEGGKKPGAEAPIQRGTAPGILWSQWKNKIQYVPSTPRMHLSKLTDFANRKAAGNTRSISQHLTASSGPPRTSLLYAVRASLEPQGRWRTTVP